METSLEARELLEVCKQIESAVGRVPSVRFGPRAVDLDIVVYGEHTIDTRIQSERDNLENLEGHLVVPHPRMSEREFVLRPLNELVLFVSTGSMYLCSLPVLSQNGFILDWASPFDLYFPWLC